MLSAKTSLMWLLLVYSAHFAHGGTCDLGQIGKERSIYSINPVPVEHSVVWTADGTTVYDSADEPALKYPERYDGSNGHLSIKNVTLQDAVNYTKILRVEGNTQLWFWCVLDVFKLASPPTCENITLSGATMRTSCTTSEVYPQAKCQFQLQGWQGERMTIESNSTSITYNHTDPATSLDYYSSTCSLNYSVVGLRPGKYSLQFNMYPDLTGLSSDKGTFGYTQNRLSIAPPSTAPVVSAQSLQHDHVLVQGDDVTVTCQVSGGSPPVHSVTLTCEKDSVNTSSDDVSRFVTHNATIASLTIENIGLVENLTECTCNATHITGLYNLTGNLQLILQGDQGVNEAASPTHGGFVTVSVTTAIIMFFSM